ncbi:MAG: hypothetical protein IJV14_00195, partial [Lachnospiraceae bacterium]|nr:hypothetical protein [Lachnospiraceae bacterium]
VNAGVTYGPGGFDQSPALAYNPVYGVSGYSNVQMYVNEALAKDGISVDVGSIVGLTFTVNSGYKLIKVEKISSGGFTEVLAPYGDAYWYTITEQDASGTTPTVTFRVTTEPIVSAVEYKILYSCVGTTGENFTIENLGPSATWGATTINAGNVGEYSKSTTDPVEPGDIIEICIPDSNFTAERTLAQVTIGDTNLTMGDLTHDSSGWTYQFKMPQRDMKVQVVFRDVELMNP